MDRLRILIISPEAPALPALPIAAELSQVSELEGVELVVCNGRRATRAAIGGQLGEVWDVFLWYGHGAPGRLFAADGPVPAEWLACMMRQCPPGVALLTACYSGARDDSLHSLAESLSQSSITCVGMWISVSDRAGLVYCVEFLRAHVSGRPVAVAQVAMEFPSQAAAFLLPGLLNGYGRIERRLGSIEGRLTRIERGLGIESIT